MRLMFELLKRKNMEIPEDENLESGSTLALQHLTSEDLLIRKVGYALCIPKFHILSPEIRRTIKMIWTNEPNKPKLSRDFIDLCDKTFSAE